MDNNSPAAIGWVLEAPSTTGGKEYRILVFGKFVVVGWGSRRGPMQYKVHTKFDANTARQTALELTSSKEAKGYLLTEGPTSSQHPATAFAVELPKLADMRGGSFYFDNVFRDLSVQGTPLAG